MLRYCLFPAVIALAAPACTERSRPAMTDRPAPHLGPGDRLAGRSFASRSPVLARNGMAATAHPLATQIAIDILQAGGSAVDAAIAANAALGLLEPVGCGIGGDLFALVWDPDAQEVVGFNGSGRSPVGRSLAQLKERLGDATQIPKFGSLAVTVPGAVDGWFELHNRYGKLEMAKVLAPAIRYAQEGTPVPQTIAYYWKRNVDALVEYHEKEPWLEEVTNAKATYAPSGRPPLEGEVFKNPDLAKTYQLLAEQGRAGFYEGPIAQTVEAYMKRVGGDLRASDFGAHRGEWVEPLSVEYRGYRVYELPPNTQGLAALQMLALLQRFDLKSLGAGRAETIHLQVEAKRLAFEDRAAYYADPSFSTVDPKWMLDEHRIEARRGLIDPSKAARNIRPTPRPLEDGDTTYLTVADDRGMMVSLIQSNYRGLGSGLVPDGLGFMLQNRGELFALSEDHPNVYAPGKRPFHTIIPALVTKGGKAWLSFGVMGGAMQPQGHVQILSNLIDFDMNLQEAGDAARWRHDGSPEPTEEPGDGRGILRVESGIPRPVREQLEKLGHRVEVGDGGFGGYQAILRDPETGVYTGATEMRKDGLALGY